MLQLAQVRSYTESAMNFRHLAPLLLAAAAAAQTPAVQKPASVEGTVINSVTGAPVRKADVTLSNGQITGEMAAMMKQYAKNFPDQTVATRSYTAASDAAGKFRFENLPPGAYWLTAKKAGFGDARYSAKDAGGGEGASFRLSAGQELTQVEVRMAPHGSISGRVLDEDGDPFPTANVSALTYTYVAGRRRLMPVDMAQTNGRGEFSLSKLPPGRYVICADVQNLQFGDQPAPPPADGSPELAYVSTYFPGATDVTQAQTTEIAAGAEVTGLSIPLRKSQVVRIKGKLVDANGDPIKAAQIMLMGGSRIGSMTMRAVNDPEGKFEIANLQPGTYTAMVMQMQGSSPKMSMIPLVVSDKNMEDVKLGPRPDGAIQGTVSVDGRAGDAKLPVKDLQVTLTPAESTAVMPAYARADADGAFTLEHVTPASYDLLLSRVPEGGYVKSVLFNGREMLGQPLDCNTSASGTLRIVLGADGGQVDAGVMREEKRVSGATVLLLPADPARRFPEAVRTAASDDSGHASFQDVPPGDYLAFAWQKVEDEIWFDPDFVKTVEDHAVKLRVGSKGSEKIELKVLP